MHVKSLYLFRKNVLEKSWTETFLQNSLKRDCDKQLCWKKLHHSYFTLAGKIFRAFALWSNYEKLPVKE